MSSALALPTSSAIKDIVPPPETTPSGGKRVSKRKGPELGVQSTPSEETPLKKLRGDSRPWNLFQLVQHESMYVIVKPQTGLYVTSRDPSQHVVIVGRGYLQSEKSSEKTLKSIGLGIYKDPKKNDLKLLIKKLMGSRLFINRVEIEAFPTPNKIKNCSTFMKAIDDCNKKVNNKIFCVVAYPSNFSDLRITKEGVMEMMFTEPKKPLKLEEKKVSREG